MYRHTQTFAFTQRTERESYSAETIILLADFFQQVILTDIKGVTCGAIKHCQIICDILV